MATQVASRSQSMRGYSRSQPAGGGDLAILSAETYVDPNLQSFLSSSPTTKKTQTAPPSNNVSQTTEGGSRKRLKRASPEEGDQDREEDEKKRSRGRPRLDIKDETAADRRRTQIRLAQRAYRNRKENAIQTLERRVQELKDTNEEMSNAFLKLHDFAVNNGLVDQAPEFGRQLRSTTEKFLTLARISSEDNSGKPDGGGESDGGLKHDDDPESRPEKTSTDAGAGTTKATGLSNLPSTTDTSRLASKADQLYGGFIVTHEPMPENDLLLTDFPNHSLIQPPQSTTDSPGYEIITQPTLENASFPFDLDLTDLSGPLFPTTTSAPGMTDPSHALHFNPFTGSLFPTLGAPASYAAQEATFGRRLQRTGVERALVLITMPNPPQKRFNRVFGFCLMLETKEAIYKRLVRGIRKTASESLHNWSFPFFNLGGAGTHFPSLAHSPSTGNGNGEGQGQRIGNQGTIDVMKPHTTNGGFNIGPFDSVVSEVGDKMLGKDMRISSAVAGFGGEYFDCDEVELYLHQRGVVIPPGADFITAEIDASHFQNELSLPILSASVGGSQRTGNSGNGNCSGNFDVGAVSMSIGNEIGVPTCSAGSGSGSGSHNSSVSTASGSANSGNGGNIGGNGRPKSPGLLSTVSSGETIAVSCSSPGDTSSTTGAPWTFNIDPVLNSAGTGGTSTPIEFGMGVPPTTMDGFTSSIATHAVSGGGGTGTGKNQTTMNFPPPPLPVPANTRKMVTVDINLLVYELIERTVCLGRTPGIKQEDINDAFWKASTVIA